MAPLPKPRKSKSLTLKVMERLREGIKRGTYPLGAPLYEKALAEEFGISKTPVREALVQLQREGLVVVQPYSGTFVFELADGEVAELCEMRLILETNAVQLAMHRHAEALAAELGAITGEMATAVKRGKPARYEELDTRFHEAFFAHCGNAYLAASAATIGAKVQTLRVNLTTPRPALMAESLEEHRRIAGALREGRVDAALEILAAHIRRARDVIRGLHDGPRPVGIGRLG